MDGRCKDCKWWSEKEQAFDTCNTLKAHWSQSSNVEMRRCESPHIFSTSRLSNHEKARDCIAEDVSVFCDPNEACTMDGSGYFDALFVGPEFGCVHFEAKDSASHGRGG